MTGTTFTARETALLESIRDAGWQIIPTPGEKYRDKVRAAHIVTPADPYEPEGCPCPVAEAANRKLGVARFTRHAWAADNAAGFLLGAAGIDRIVMAADNPDDPRRPELLRLLGVTP